MLRRSIALANKCAHQRISSLSVSSNINSNLPKQVEEEHREARTWLARFNMKDVPKHLCEVHFSRASGPGGQNVNKHVALYGIHVID